MKKLFSLGMAAALLALATAAFAYPALNATTGIVAIPTAQTVGPKVLDTAADLLFFDTTTVNGRAIYGFSNNFELGGFFTLGHTDSFGVNGKYRFPQSLAGFAWAFGLDLVASDDPDSGEQVYLTGTRNFGKTTGAGSILGTLGLDYSDFGDEQGLVPFLGLQWQVATKTELAGEYGFATGDFDENIFSVLARQRFSPDWAAQLGWTNTTGLVGSDDSGFFIGASYTFPTGRP